VSCVVSVPVDLSLVDSSFTSPTKEIVGRPSTVGRFGIDWEMKEGTVGEYAAALVLERVEDDKLVCFDRRAALLLLQKLSKQDSPPLLRLPHLNSSLAHCHPLLPPPSLLPPSASFCPFLPPP
jgi:hypothetical protein